MPNPPKPLERKRRAGNPGKRRLPQPLAIIPASTIVPVAPGGLSEVGREVWVQTWTVGSSWLAPSDAMLVEMAATMAADIGAWTDAIATEGPTYESASGMRRTHPGVAQLNVLRRELRATLSLLGFSPADRSRLGLTEVKRMSGLAELLDKRRSEIGR